jgi:hypothetical protein
MDKWLKTAAALGALPLAFGTVVFVAWLYTRSYSLLPVGLCTVVGGALLVSIGLILLRTHAAGCSRHAQPRRGLCAWHHAVPLGLLLLNFPAAVCFTWGAFVLQTRNVVTVTNEFSIVVESFRVHGAGRSVELGSIKPGQTGSCSFRAKRDGALYYDAVVGGAHMSGVAHGYVMPEYSSRSDVLVTPEGSIVVSQYEQ